MTSEAIQRYVRVALYALFSSLATVGVTLPDNTKTMIAGIVGFLLNLAWTVWGSKLSNLLSEAEKTAGVEQIKVVVDPNKIDAPALSAATPAAVAVTT